MSANEERPAVQPDLEALGGSGEESASEGRDLERNQPGVLCPKCDHLNYRNQELCERCGAQLYVDCPRCGYKNERVYLRCRQCHKRLAGGLFKHHRHRRHGRSWFRKVSWQVFQVLIVVLGIVAVGLLIYLTNKM